MPNPTLKEEVFHNLSQGSDSLELNRAMSTGGTIYKTMFLSVLMFVTAMYSWFLIEQGFADKANLLMTTGLLGGFVTAMIVCFAPKNNFLMLSTSIYALFEGLFLGGISAIFNQYYPGVATQAVIGTIAAVFSMLIVYHTKLFQASETFVKTIIIATSAIAGIYILQIILSFFHLSIPQIFSNSPIGIAFSVIVCAVAAFNLIIDFDFIDRFSGHAPKYMEWYGAFSLMVTIIWLYMEILRLLAKINSRR